MGMNAGQGILENRKLFCPSQDLNPGPSRWLYSSYTDHEGPALAVLPFGKKPYSHCQEIGWAPGPVWSRAVNLVPTMGFNPQTLQSVGKHYTYYAGRADKKH
jgi:hypothetical protein